MPFWVVDWTTYKDGRPKPVIIGGRGFSSEYRAQAYKDESNLSPRAEIFETQSVQANKAVQEIRTKLIKRFKSLDKGMTRFSHKVETINER